MTGGEGFDHHGHYYVLVETGLFRCFHNPANPDMDNRIFERAYGFLHVPAHGGTQFIASNEGPS